MTAGKAIYPNVEAYRNKIASLPDGMYLNSIEQCFNIRSIKQNNSCWGIAYLYIEQALLKTGQYKNISKEQVHQFAMHHCLPADYKERIYKEWQDDPGMIDIKTGEVFKSAFRLTTTKMTTKDAMNYYEEMQAFYLEWFSSNENDFIPDPDPNWKNKKI